MNNCLSVFEAWLSDPFFDKDTRLELSSLTDPAEIEDRFCRDLEFGTAGLRGVMQAGTNRMNRYTVRRATKGLARWLASRCDDLSGGVAIAYDTRNHSAEFALEAALTLCRENIPVHLFFEATPTPVLSYAVRSLGCLAGIVITASHNPKEYNGYKIYDKDGCQLLPDDARELTSFIKEVSVTSAFVMEKSEALDKGLLKFVGNYVIDAFTEECRKEAHPLSPYAKSALKVVYSPLFGSGYKAVTLLLGKEGYKNVSVVKSQALPDGNFPSLRVPNPEEPQALSAGIRQAGEEQADLVFATDPDCDRIAVAVLHNGFHQTLSGNTLGALLVNYVLTRRAVSLKPDSVIVKSAVTGELGAAVAKSFGVKTVETLTGFKYIGDFIRQGEGSFVMGYEESCGYLVGTHCLDKDAVVTSMLVCEMAAYYKELGKTLLDVLDDLYTQFGVHSFLCDAYKVPGLDWAERVKSSMEALRAKGADAFTGRCTFIDYAADSSGLPKADMLKYIFPDGSWMAVRPSGTEPKFKVYHFAKSTTRTGAADIIASHRRVIEAFLPAGAAK